MDVQSAQRVFVLCFALPAVFLLTDARVRSHAAGRVRRRAAEMREALETSVFRKCRKRAVAPHVGI